MSLPDKSERVRIAPEIVAKLETEGSGPVHVFGIERQEDGTLDLILQTPDPLSAVRGCGMEVTSYQVYGNGTCQMTFRPAHALSEDRSGASAPGAPNVGGTPGACFGD